MRLNDEERKAVGEALRELAAGRAPRFEDRLWLAFGDCWTSVRAILERHGHIEMDGDITGAITPRGRRLLEALTVPQHARAS